MDADDAAPDGPDSKRQRVGESFNRVRRDTFVEAMLMSVANTLASDAAYGFNSANRIRQRVEDIVDEIDDKSGDPVKSSSRAVLESRFALGADDAQYLSQAVSMLWSGDGGERLRIAPLSSMPSIMRVASAKGMVKAMSSVVKQRRTHSMSTLKRSLCLASWLLQIQSVRYAIFDILSNFKKIQPSGAELKAELESRVGSDQRNPNIQAMCVYVEGLADGKEADMERAKSLVFAFLVILNPGSSANAIVRQLLSAMKEVTLRAEFDFAQLFNVANEIHGAPGMRSYSGGAASKYKCSDVYTPELAKTAKFEEVVSSLKEAVKRIGSDNKQLPNRKSNATSNTIGPSSSSDANKTWLVSSVLSPVWQNKKKDEWRSILGDKGAPIEPTRASMNMASASNLHNRGTRRFEGDITNFKTSVLDGQVTLDESFSVFCVLRGLCGFPGAHQFLSAPCVVGAGGSSASSGPGSSGSSGGSASCTPSCTAVSSSSSGSCSFLKYDYPDKKKFEKYRPGEFVDQEETSLGLKTSELLVECDSDLYYSTKYLLDTDFVGNALNSSDSERPQQRICADGTYEEGVDRARRACWLPVAKGRLDFDTKELDTYNHMICEASVYEFMDISLRNPSNNEQDREVLLLFNAAAAVAKLRQLESISFLRSRRPTDGTLHDTSQMGGDIYVTRPCRQCSTSVEGVYHKRLLVPVDAGVARFAPQPMGVPGPLQIEQPDTTDTLLDHPFLVSDVSDVDRSIKVPNAALSGFMSSGLQSGWTTRSGLSDVALPDDEDAYSLYMDAPPEAEPFDSSTFQDYTTMAPSSQINPDDVDVVNMFSCFVNASNAIDTIEQIECEEMYVKRLETDGSEEQQRVFGINKNVEDVSRDRGTDIWTDAMREVAISGDRLYRFVTQLTGSIGEAADAAISWEDEDLKAMAKEAATKQKAMAERVSRFQTKLVESVVSSTLRSSKLQLDVRDKGSAGNELVVINSDVKDSIRQITSGEAGHGFFESSVELGHLIGTTSKPITIKDLVGKLQMVSHEFQDQIQQSMAGSTSISYSRIAEPRNSFMMHLKPDTSAAIHKAFDLITSELRVCPGYHRHIFLWEYIEGKDWVLTTRFAELVGLMLQNTRMRSGSFAAYVGTSQIVTNTHNIRIQIQRLKEQACNYISTTATPNFLTAYGRTHYFGGSMKKTSKDDEEGRKVLRIKSSNNPQFGEDSGYDDYWGSLKNGPTKIRPSVVRRINELTKKLLNGEVDARVFRLTPGRRLNQLVGEPSRYRTDIGASNAEAAYTSHLMIMRELVTKTKQELLDLIKTVEQAKAFDVTTVTSTNDYESPCDQFKADVWITSVCKQLQKQGIRFDGEKFLLPEEQRDGLLSSTHYKIKVEVTEEMLQAMKPRPKEGQELKANSGLSLKMSETLAMLFFPYDFDFRKGTNQRLWKPHRKWTRLDGPKGEFDSVWTMEAYSIKDAVMQERYLTAARLGAMGTVGMKGRSKMLTAMIAGALYLNSGLSSSEQVKATVAQTMADAWSSTKQFGESSGDYMAEKADFLRQTSLFARAQEYTDYAMDQPWPVAGATLDALTSVGQYAWYKADEFKEEMKETADRARAVVAEKKRLRKRSQIENDPLVTLLTHKTVLDKEIGENAEKLASLTQKTGQRPLQEDVEARYKKRFAGLESRKKVLEDAKDSLAFMFGLMNKGSFDELKEAYTTDQRWLRFEQVSSLSETEQLQIERDGSLVNLLGSWENIKDTCNTVDHYIDCLSKMSPRSKARLVGSRMSSSAISQLVSQKEIQESKALIEESTDRTFESYDIPDFAIPEDASTEHESLKAVLKIIKDKEQQDDDMNFQGKVGGGAMPDALQNNYKFFQDTIEKYLDDPDGEKSKTPVTKDEVGSMLAFLQMGPAWATKFQDILAPSAWRIMQLAQEGNKGSIEALKDSESFDRVVETLKSSQIFTDDPELATKAAQELRDVIEATNGLTRDGSDTVMVRWAIKVLDLVTNKVFDPERDPGPLQDEDQPSPSRVPSKNSDDQAGPSASSAPSPSANAPPPEPPSAPPPQPPSAPVPPSPAPVFPPGAAPPPSDFTGEYETKEPEQAKPAPPAMPPRKAQPPPPPGDFEMTDADELITPNLG